MHHVVLLTLLAAAMLLAAPLCQAEPDGVTEYRLTRQHEPVKLNDLLEFHGRRYNAFDDAQAGTVDRAARALGDVRLNNALVSVGQYLGDLYVGTPKQRIRGIEFNTASADTWVVAEPRNSRGFNSSRSTTYSSTNTFVNVPFGPPPAPSLRFQIVRDSVSFLLRNSTTRFVGVSNYKFATLPQSAAARFFSPVQNGVVGLAWPRRARLPSTPIVYQLVKSGAIKSGFGTWYNATEPRSQRDAEASTGGLITIGGVNRQLFSGPLRYAPVVNQTTWTLALSSVAYGTNAAVKASVTGQVIVDTTLPFVLAPAETLAALFKRTSVALDPARRVFYVEIAKYKLLKPITFKVGAIVLTLDPRDYVFRPSSNAAFGGPPPIVVNGQPCYVISLFPAPGLPGWVFGQPVLQKYYAHFDYAGAKVGFAPAKR